MQHCEQLFHRCLVLQQGDGTLLLHEQLVEHHCCVLVPVCSLQYQQLGCTANEHQHLPSPSQQLSTAQQPSSLIITALLLWGDFFNIDIYHFSNQFFLKKEFTLNATCTIDVQWWRGKWLPTTSLPNFFTQRKSDADFCLQKSLYLHNGFRITVWET